jgi:hypothetical protein
MLLHSSALSLAKRFARDAKRHIYITPTMYLELLNSYKRLYAARHAEVSAARTRYENGLGKLLFTEGQVMPPLHSAGCSVMVALYVMPVYVPLIDSRSVW